MRIVDFSLYSTYPPRSGGQARTSCLNLALSERHEVFQFDFMPYAAGGKKGWMESFLYRKRFTSVPLKSRIVHVAKQYKEYTFANPFFLIGSYVLHKPFDSGSPVFVPLLDAPSRNIARNKIAKSDIAQVEGIWLFDWVYGNKPKKTPIVLVEYNLYYQVFRDNAYVEKKEKNAVEKADLLFVASETDAENISDHYRVERNKIVLVPNGVDTSKFRILAENEKRSIKKDFGFSDKKIVLFAGSKWAPNIEAAQAIRQIASEVEDDNIVFLVAGSVGDSVRRTKTKNIFYTGYVDNILLYFAVADIAINPMLSGSGTNLKILDYLAAGLPVITTRFGARGLPFEDNKHFMIREIEEFPEGITNLIQDEKKCSTLGKEGRKAVERYFDWKVIARKVSYVYQELVEAA